MILSETVCKEIGNYIGSYIESNINNFSGVWRTYMHIRVSIDVQNSLKQLMCIKKVRENRRGLLTFKYERLPTFCFFCGMIGHSD